MYIDGTVTNSNGAKTYADTDSAAQAVSANTSRQSKNTSEQDGAASGVTGDAVSLSPAALALASQASIFSGDQSEDKDTGQILQEFLAKLQESKLDLVEVMLQVMKKNHEAAMESAERSAEKAKEDAEKATVRTRENRQEEAEEMLSVERRQYQESRAQALGREQGTTDLAGAESALIAEPFFTWSGESAQTYGKTGTAKYQGVSSSSSYKARV